VILWFCDSVISRWCCICQDHNIACTCLSFCINKVSSMSDCSGLSTAWLLLLSGACKCSLDRVPTLWLQMSSVWKLRIVHEKCTATGAFFYNLWNHGQIFTLFLSGFLPIFYCEGSEWDFHFSLETRWFTVGWFPALVRLTLVLIGWNLSQKPRGKRMVSSYFHREAWDTGWNQMKRLWSWLSVLLIKQIVSL